MTTDIKVEMLSPLIAIGSALTSSLSSLRIGAHEHQWRMMHLRWTADRKSHIIVDAVVVRDGELGGATMVSHLRLAIFH
jgi:hypothetical protein